eukprot:2855965-Prymnesium_polylepis.1
MSREGCFNTHTHTQGLARKWAAPPQLQRLHGSQAVSTKVHIAHWAPEPKSVKSKYRASQWNAPRSKNHATTRKNGQDSRAQLENMRKMMPGMPKAHKNLPCHCGSSSI